MDSYTDLKELEKKINLLEMICKIGAYDEIDEIEDKWYIYILELEGGKFYIDKTKYPSKLKSFILSDSIKLKGIIYKILKIKDLFIGNEEDEDLCYENNYRLYMKDLLRYKDLDNRIDDLNKSFTFINIEESSPGSPRPRGREDKDLNIKKKLRSMKMKKLFNVRNISRRISSTQLLE